jgi:excinuclease ABC subunit C
MFDIKEELKKLPSKPGVYIMKNDLGEIIYIGKAVNLKNRVRQYFQSNKNHSAKVISMVRHIAEFEYIVVDNEMEALILECNLIKKHSPKYNIRLKDDKMYPYVKVTVNEDFPRVLMVRKVLKDGAKYYGPITDSYAVKETIEMINRMWPIRKCRKILPRDIGKERHCLNYHIGQCLAPCDGLISKEEYKKIVDEVIEFLDGKSSDIIKRLKEKMNAAAENLEYEKAAQYRDKIKSIMSIEERQKMSNTGLNDSDVIALSRALDDALIQVFFIRGGKMLGREHYMINNTEGLSRSEIITGFIKQFYSGTAFIPKELILEAEIVPEEKDVIDSWLTQRRGSKVLITVPEKGEKKRLVDLAYKNASITFEQFGDKMKRDEQRTRGAVAEICKTISLNKKVERIEAYDISNIQGFYSVGAMVVFENGIPKRSDYRKFKIKSVVGANDFASMQEVLQRRLAHGIKEDKKEYWKLPDLILMDGGKPQVSAAQSVLKTYGLQIPVCGMFKDDNHRTKGLLYNDKEYYMPSNTEGFKLTTRIQDEVHRFAIEYHRKLRESAQVDTVLNHIPGIGEVRRKALLKHFGDIESIKRAEVSDLLEVECMNIKSAESVYAFFRRKGAKQK